MHIFPFCLHNIILFFFSVPPLLPIEDIYMLPSSKSDEESAQPSEPADEFE